MPQKICCSILNNLASSIKVRVVDFRAPCFFYRSRGEEFNLDEMMPKGICPDLFFQIYPQYLSLLYGGHPGNIKKEVKVPIVCCPGARGKTFWLIRGKKLLLSPIINLAAGFFRLIGKPKDLFERKIVIDLVKKEGYCPRYNAGKIVFSFNQYSHLWQRRFFCPAVFYTLYPFLISPSAQTGEKKEVLRIQCPADSAAIIFEVKINRA